METIKKLLGKQIELFFTTGKGISLSQANSIKNDNTNKAEGLLANFNNEVYNLVHLIMASDTSNTQSVEAEKITPEEFDKLQTVSSLFAENAILGHGINLYKQFEKELTTLESDQIANTFEINIPQFSYAMAQLKPTVKYPATVESVLDLDKIEDMIAKSSDEVLAQLNQEQMFGALRNESIAAVLGKQLTKKESFLKKLLAAPKVVSLDETVTNFALISKRKELAYSDAEITDFEKLQEKLYTEYNEVQSKVNSFKKTLKDTIRSVELQFRQEFEAKQLEYNNSFQKYTNDNNQVQAKAQTIKQTALAELASLKIKMS